MVSNNATLLAREAIPDDIPSLTTIIPRSYDADTFLMKVLPAESPLIREWWAEVYSKAIASPACHILTEVDGDTVVGVLTLHFWNPVDPNSTPGGICTFVPLTNDHHEATRDALASQVKDRTEYMKDRPNFLIDLMAIDRKYQGMGVGKRLARRACDIADAKGAAIFLQTTKARMYYLNLGLAFQSETGDEAGVVVRPPQPKSG